MNYFTAAFAFLITIVCFWMSIKLIKTYFKVRGWKKSEATILSKKVEIRKRRSNSGTAIYIPVIEYVYEYNGNSYTGSKVYLEELLGGARSARQHQVEAKLKTMGEKQMIFVDRNDPAKSVMYCDGVGMYFFIMAMGVLSFLIGLGYLVNK